MVSIYGLGSNLLSFIRPDSYQTKSTNLKYQNWA